MVLVAVADRTQSLLPSMHRLFVACSLIAVLIVAGCGGAEGERSYADRVQQWRLERDMEMRGETSVIPATRRKRFQGLVYYDVDSTYRFVVPLRRAAVPDTVMMAESTGGIAEQIRVGHVVVPFPPRADTLAVLQVKSGKEKGQLWLPFADATNGPATYDAGRYVDLRPAGDASEGASPAAADSVVVDFNRAYNPTCAYNPEYACPLPPDENRLPFPVPAGEKKPQFR
jgi:uncharacterized protein (DUF1684 family)